MILIFTYTNIRNIPETTKLTIRILFEWFAPLRSDKFPNDIIVWFFIPH
jgi:hypothetical protein